MKRAYAIKLNGKTIQTVGGQSAGRYFQTIEKKRKAVRLDNKKRTLKENIKLIKKIFRNGVIITWTIAMLACAFRFGVTQPKAEAQTPAIPVISDLQGSFESADPANQGDLFDIYFKGKAGEARKVAQCESGMNPNAHNLKSDDRGILQINYSTWHKVFGDVNYYDLETNIKLSSEIYNRSGSWSPWVSSIKCHGLE